MIYVLCPDDNKPWGGIRKLYRHVDVLRGHGWPATILHKQPGFRCTWFFNQTPVAYTGQTAFHSSDFVAVPEVYGPNIPSMFTRLRKVIFNQNCYSTFRGFQLDWPDAPMPYSHPEVVAAFVVSEDSQEYLRYVFPQLRVYRLRYSIDSNLFRATEPKLQQIAFMPRKQGDDIVQVLNILKTRQALEGYALIPIDQKSESESAGHIAGFADFLELWASRRIRLASGRGDGLWLHRHRLPWWWRTRVLPSGILISG